MDMPSAMVKHLATSKVGLFCSYYRMGACSLVLLNEHMKFEAQKSHYTPEVLSVQSYTKALVPKSNFTEFQ